MLAKIKGAIKRLWDGLRKMATGTTVGQVSVGTAVFTGILAALPSVTFEAAVLYVMTQLVPVVLIFALPLYLVFRMMYAPAVRPMHNVTNG